jgi:hypothetical protein
LKLGFKFQAGLKQAYLIGIQKLASTWAVEIARIDFISG